MPLKIIPDKKLRWELWDNSITSPKDYDKGTGQSREWVRIPPDRWYIAFHHPEICEFFCSREFFSIEARRAYLDIVKFLS